MRIAISGAHRTGKTSLAEELGRCLPGYEVIDEPYYLLAEEGYEFEEMPSLEDFELQLERSIESILGSGADQIFDRCPADIVAYLLTHPQSDRFDLAGCLPRVRSAMEHLDLIVFVPIEEPDRMALLEPADHELRQRVDETIREIVLADRFDLDQETIEVGGSVRDRARQVLARINELG